MAKKKTVKMELSLDDQKKIKEAFRAYLEKRSDEALKQMVADAKAGYVVDVMTQASHALVFEELANDFQMADLVGLEFIEPKSAK